MRDQSCVLIYINFLFPSRFHHFIRCVCVIDFPSRFFFFLAWIQWIFNSAEIQPHRHAFSLNPRFLSVSVGYTLPGYPTVC